MALVPSTMPELGLPAPQFSLPDTAGRTVTIDDFSEAAALLVTFWCSHCPFVRHIREGFAAFAREYQAKDVAIVAISSNDEISHPQDGPEQMRADVEVGDREGRGLAQDRELAGEGNHGDGQHGRDRGEHPAVGGDDISGCRGAASPGH